jgi:HD superfamily phosphohydrolase/predicted Ser/Thr protein kinase
MTPEEIGGYRVIASLGSGDFATVYRVERDGVEHALKAAHSNQGGARDRLRIEADALAMFEHSCIPSLVAADPDNEPPYLVMELARGRTIKRLIEDHERERSVAGDVEALRIIALLLEGLAHVHERGFVHRDIKDANVIFSGTTQELKILDFGFCKADGSHDTRLDDSFFRAGSIRFSPPSKIENPGTARASHDVFAAGVLAYRLLTNRYPWETRIGQDFGDYARHQQTSDPEPVREHNQRVHSDLNRLVMSLIERNDQRRPAASEAAAKARDILARLDTSGIEAIRGEQVRFTRVTRDPLYGDIRLTEGEREALNTPELQRLRTLKQLGLTNLVYEGAQHTRLSHALGCVYRVEQILRAVEDNVGIRIDAETRLISRLYALVHDVTHVAFGHTVEDELGIYVRHDSNAGRIERLLLADTSKLGQILRRSEIGREVLKFFDPDSSIHARSEVRDLIASSTGADVLDYIDRDAYHCGLDHRVDSAIFRQFRIGRVGGGEASDEERLVSLLYGSTGVRLDREFAVESLLHERYAMFLKVYTHGRKAAASALLGKAIGAAVYPHARTQDFGEDEYEWMADDVVIDRLRRSQKQAVRVSAERLARRQLPRLVYRAWLLGETDRTEEQYHARREHLRAAGLFDPERRRAIEAELARSARIGPQDVYVYCPGKAPGYQRVRHVISRRPGASALVDSVADPYYGIRRKHLGLWEIIVCSSDADRGSDGALAAEARDRFGFENQVASDTRSGRLW